MIRTIADVLLTGMEIIYRFASWLKEFSWQRLNSVRVTSSSKHFPDMNNLLSAQQLLAEIKMAESTIRQLDLGFFDQPQRYARKTDPEESWLAARSITDIRRSQWEVYKSLLSIGPCIDERLVDIMQAMGSKQSESGIRTRRSELVTFGLVIPTTEKFFTKYGNLSQVWRARDWKEWMDWLNDRIARRINV